MRFLLLLVIMNASFAAAGTWGDGKWGRMYWGSNTESSPTAAPRVDAQGDGTDIIFALMNLLRPQEQGWSVITGFDVTCNGLTTVTISADNPRLTGLEPDTQYDCTIVAINDVGRSPAGSFIVTTDSLGGGLPIWLLYQATQS